jgi:hypothetical protein
MGYHQEMLEAHTALLDTKVDMAVASLMLVAEWELNQFCHWLWVQLVDRLLSLSSLSPPLPDAQLVYIEYHQEVLEAHTALLDTKVDMAVASLVLVGEWELNQLCHWLWVQPVAPFKLSGGGSSSR